MRVLTGGGEFHPSLVEMRMFFISRKERERETRRGMDFGFDPPASSGARELQRERGDERKREIERQRERKRAREREKSYVHNRGIERERKRTSTEEG